jgi:hypothetical protein
MKKLLTVTLLALVFLILNGNTVSVDAAQIEGTGLEDMGEYTVTQTVMQRVRVYIDENQVDFIESTGKYVYTQETKWYFLGIYTHSTYKYYFYEDKFVDVIVEQRQLYNDIDTLIFMVTELEELADDYGCRDVKNCVLGYLRSINIEYSDDSSLYDKWSVTAGLTDMGFVNYVEQVDGTGIEFNEYFGQFLPYKDEIGAFDENGDQIPDGRSDYYNYKYGFVSSTYLKKQLHLIDPFNGSNSTGIDVSHMFASIDGAYQDTGNLVSLGNDHQQDLQDG